MATIGKHYKVAALLCENGANLTVANVDGNTPLFYAPKTWHSNLQGNI